jgi:hypothetical protein
MVTRTGRPGRTVAGARSEHAGGRVNTAVTDRCRFIVTTHEPVPEQAPSHPANFEPGSALARSGTFPPAK